MFSDHNFGKTHIKPLPSFILHAMNADDAYKPIQRATLSEASWRILRIAQSVELRHPVSHETALAICPQIVIAPLFRCVRRKAVTLGRTWTMDGVEKVRLSAIPSTLSA